MPLNAFKWKHFVGEIDSANSKMVLKISIEL